MIKIIVVIAVVFLVDCDCCDRKEDELLSVVAIFRHGDKMPKEAYFDVYPNNPWMNPKLWNSSDLGSVTNKGKLNIFDRGKWLRQRYATFLPEKYSQKYVRVQSSDSDRVLVSAQLILAGLYPPKGTDVWHDKLPWQPIPIHTLPDNDDMIVSQLMPCSKFTKMLNKQLQSRTDDLTEVKFLGQHTGKEITSLEQVYKLYKLLRIAEENGMVIPNWAENSMQLMKKKTDEVCKLHSLTPEMQRFKSGPLFHTVFSHFDNVLDKTKRVTKMLLFAGHSRTITNVLMALDSYTEVPPYTATLIFELKKNCNGTIIIDVYYQTTANGIPSEIIKNMPYTAFKQKLSPIVVDPDRWKKECRTWFGSMWGDS